MFSAVTVDWWMIFLSVAFVYEFGRRRGILLVNSSKEDKNRAFLFFVEEQKGTFYGYNSNNEFIGQASSLAELTVLIQEKEPGYQFYLAVEKPKKDKHEPI